MAMVLISEKFLAGVGPDSLKAKIESRLAEIEAFSKAIQAAGKRLLPQGTDAARIRALADFLGTQPAATKKWFYGQNGPTGWTAAAILEKLRNLDADTEEFDAADLPPITAGE